MQILSTIIPIFLIISLGFLIKKREFMSDAFLGPANQIVYYIAIPAMIFSSVAKASFHNEFDIKILLITFASLLLTTAAALLVTTLSDMPNRLKGTFIQSSFHGNFGYIGLAVVFYYLGSKGFANASIFAGFIMILQNSLAVAVLQYYADDKNNLDIINKSSNNNSSGNNTIGNNSSGNNTIGNKQNKKNKSNSTLHNNIKAIIKHPIILSAIFGMAFSLSEITLPQLLDRTLSILSGMALPLALLLIGATISFKVIKSHLISIVQISFFKLIVMPAIGFLLFRLFSIPTSDYLPAFILLASPTATMVYVMAKEMQGDTEFAVAALSACNMLSALTFTLWLNILA